MDILRAHAHFIHHQYHLTLELILRNLSLGIIGCSRLPSENACVVLIRDQQVNSVRVTNCIEVVVKISYDKHNNKVCNDIKLRFTSDKYDVNV